MHQVGASSSQSQNADQQDDAVGDIARRYVGGIADNIQSISVSAGDLLKEFVAVPPAPHDAAVSAIAEWFMVSPNAEPVPSVVSRNLDEVPGRGAGGGCMGRCVLVPKR